MEQYVLFFKRTEQRHQLLETSQSASEWLSVIDTDCDCCQRDIDFQRFIKIWDDFFFFFVVALLDVLCTYLSSGNHRTTRIVKAPSSLFSPVN
jgi:hypothetical protein